MRVFILIHGASDEVFSKRTLILPDLPGQTSNTPDYFDLAGCAGLLSRYLQFVFSWLLARTVPESHLWYAFVKLSAGTVPK
jgi:hypothetical protein